MKHTSEFLKIVHNGSRKPLQRAKLRSFTKGKHPAVRNTLNMVAARAWGLNYTDL